MSIQLRKLRGVIGISLIWGILWATVFAVIVTIIGIVDPDSIDPGEEPAIIAAMGGAIGIVSGVIFGILLAVAESGRELSNFSLLRPALWGMLSSAMFPLLAGKYEQVFVMCPIGIVVALALVVIARKAERVASTQQNLLRDAFLACFLTPVRDVINPSDRTLT